MKRWRPVRESHYKEVVCRWLKRAEEDLLVARDEIDHVAWASVFHSQQAAEKALKALLIACGKRPPKTHRLELLIELLKRSGVETEEMEQYKLQVLSDYAVEARYPDFEDEPTLEEASEALDLAVKTVELVKEKLKEHGLEC